MPMRPSNVSSEVGAGAPARSSLEMSSSSRKLHALVLIAVMYIVIMSKRFVYRVKLKIGL